MIITLDTSTKTFHTFFTLSLFLFSFVLLGSATYSWTDPTGTPPNNNVEAPINVSSASQIKGGPIQVNGFLNVGSSVVNGNLGVGVSSPSQKLDVSGYIRSTTGFCIGGSCITSWPSGGGGGISSATTVQCEVGSGSQCIATCPSGYYRTGCSLGGNARVSPYGSNACRGQTSSGLTGNVVAYCAK